LNTVAPANTARRERVQQRKERPTHHKQQKGTVSKNTKQNNKKGEN
jgi:hypothetical protein